MHLLQETRKTLEEQQKGLGMRRSASAVPAPATALNVQTDVELPAPDITPAAEDPHPPPQTRYAKTLRLTSEQLVSTNTSVLCMTAEQGAFAEISQPSPWAEYDDFFFVSNRGHCLHGATISMGAHRSHRRLRH